MSSSLAPASGPRDRGDERLDGLRRLAREKLGRLLAASVFRELRALPRLLADDEEVQTMALARIAGRRRLVGSGRLVVVTDARLLLFEKGFLTGRERVESFPWAELTGVRAQPTRLEVDHAGGTVKLTPASGVARVREVADAIRSRVEGGESEERSSAALVELARRKLGRFLGAATEPEAMALAEVLGEGEQVLDLGYARHRRAGLLVATPTRLLFVRTPAFRRRRHVESYPYAELEAVELEPPKTIRAATGGHRLVFSGIAPAERAEGIALAARSRVGGDASLGSRVAEGE